MKTSPGKFVALISGTALLGGLADGQLVRVANTTLNLPAALPAATGYTTENALGSLTFSQPMVVTSAPGETNRLFIAERGGVIRVVSNLATTPASAAYLNLTSLLGGGETLTTDGENGFLSLVFHPDFVNNRTLFVYYSIQVSEGGSTKQFQRLHRIVLSSATSNTPTISSHQPMLTIVDRATNHNGGSLGFGPDGYLYLSLGDEGNADDSFDNARYINQRFDSTVKRTGFWGKMLRLDVDNRAGSLTPNASQQNSTTFPSAVHTGTYKIPADNPFIGTTSWHNETIDPLTVRTEIYATGLRNPFRWTFDQPTGRLFLGDVGQNTWEEIDIIQKGGDYGWSWREAKHAHTPSAPPVTGFNPIEPIYEYDRSGGNCVTGGAVYRGNRLTELYGAYIFADYNGGNLVALRESGGTWSSQTLANNVGVVNFGHDPRDGDLLFCNLNNGTIRRFVRAGTSGTAPPATLSAVGAFSNLAALTPQAGIVPYDVNVPFWSDHAIKQRWFSIKNTTDKVTYSRDGNWTLPSGMVWIKHFNFETTRGDPATARKLETRVLVKTADGTYGLSYRWRADQSDADLVAENGLDDPISVTVNGTATTQTWRFPSRSECMNCHTPVGGHALSFNTRQLNHDHLYGSQTLNQIAALKNAGYLSNTTIDGVNTLPKYATADDSAQSLEWRVRSYFAVNCSQCHQPGGPASGNWDARATVEMDAAQIINGLLLNNFGNAANRFVIPGDTTHSVALGRISRSLSKMPPIGSNVVDQSAVDLLTAWINQDLPSRQSFSQWQTAKFGTPVPATAAATADPDGDGLTNQAEFLAGTNPLAADSASLLKLEKSAASLHFSYTLPANRSMTIETSSDLSANSWTAWDVPGNAPFFPAAGGAQVREFPQPAAGKQFFRGRISTP
jgi:uncharacterized repeat protein (TIGR03806 family)